MAKRVTHPIRSKIDDGVRVEGWGVYLEEGAQRLGLFADAPRVRELIDIFGVFRAARVAGDVKLQLNRATVSDVVAAVAGLDALARRECRAGGRGDLSAAARPAMGSATRSA
jgi:uncharacterized protein (DUF885 family)